MTTYRDAEALRKAQWIVKHPMDYTDAEIKRAGATMRRLEAKREAQRAHDRAVLAERAAQR